MVHKRRDVTRYVMRALGKQSVRGTFALAEVIDADDLAALDRTGNLLAFLRVVGPSFEMSIREAGEIDGTLAVLERVRANLADEALNWKEGV